MDNWSILTIYSRMVGFAMTFIRGIANKHPGGTRKILHITTGFVYRVTDDGSLETRDGVMIVLGKPDAEFNDILLNMGVDWEKREPGKQWIEDLFGPVKWQNFHIHHRCIKLNTTNEEGKKMIIMRLLKAESSVDGIHRDEQQILDDFRTKGEIEQCKGIKYVGGVWTANGVSFHVEQHSLGG